MHKCIVRVVANAILWHNLRVASPAFFSKTTGIQPLPIQREGFDINRGTFIYVIYRFRLMC